MHGINLNLIYLSNMATNYYAKDLKQDRVKLFGHTSGCKMDNASQISSKDFEWSEWVSNCYTVILIQLFFLACVFLALAVLIKIVQVKTGQKNKAQHDSQLQEIKNRQQQDFRIIKCTRNKLLKSQQTFAIYYSFYKQLLYLKTGAYHGTNMTSIFATLDKEKQCQNENNSQKNQKDPQNNQKDSQNNLKHPQNNHKDPNKLKRLQQMISSSTQSLVDTIQVLINNLIVSNLAIKSNALEPKTKQNQTQTQRHIKLSQVFQYHLPIKAQLFSLKQKVSRLNEGYKSINQHQNHQQFLQVVKDSVFVINQCYGFVTYLMDNLIQSPLGDQENVPVQVKSMQQEIDCILSLILTQNSQKEQFMDQRQPDQNGFYQLKSNLLSLIQRFSENKREDFTKNPNQTDFLNNEISQLNVLLQQIRFNKSLLQNSQIPQQNLTESIKVYSTNLSLNQHKKQQYNSQNLRQKHNLTGIQAVEQSQRGFSVEKKLSFIKQLDRLMVRNRIRKQMQEMQQKIKLQQNLHSLSDANELSLQVTLQTI